MSYLRFTIDMAIKQPLPTAIQNALPTIRQKIRQLKTFAENINEGEDNEEDTTKAVYHICHHDTGELCEEEQDI